MMSLFLLAMPPPAAATDIISLIHTDVGRCVAEIVLRLIGYERLVEDTQPAMDTLIPGELPESLRKSERRNRKSPEIMRDER